MTMVPLVLPRWAIPSARLEAELTLPPFLAPAALIPKGVENPEALGGDEVLGMGLGVTPGAAAGFGGTTGIGGVGVCITFLMFCAAFAMPVVGIRKPMAFSLNQHEPPYFMPLAIPPFFIPSGLEPAMLTCLPLVLPLAARPSRLGAAVRTAPILALVMPWFGLL